MRRALLAVLLATAAVLGAAAPALAVATHDAGGPPQPPQRYFGHATYANGTAASGVTVTVAYDGATLNTTTTNATGYYDVYVDDPTDTRTNERVVLTAANDTASATWEPAGSTQVDFVVAAPDSGSSGGSDGSAGGDTGGGSDSGDTGGSGATGGSGGSDGGSDGGSSPSTTTQATSTETNATTTETPTDAASTSPSSGESDGESAPAESTTTSSGEDAVGGSTSTTAAANRDGNTTNADDRDVRESAGLGSFLPWVGGVLVVALCAAFLAHRYRRVGDYEYDRL
ncbi:hypothetical protein [Halocalculus aciditolerans]|uniref:Uncharacterized protein n=1 Tax=Halocalculus aciditolerans TaxID=1383812 RepID=A0A830F0Q8_9EURY|nr:hypothetical protein [Halocalculus aciditolerans]GGL50006.1 hypothetical protein GCM10009039_05180 [Halocalculus aciditolerans]